MVIMDYQYGFFGLDAVEYYVILFNHTSDVRI